MQVGLLVALSSILAARPEVLLSLAPSLLDNAASYSHPRRLPFQLWIIHQTVRYNCHNVFPVYPQDDSLASAATLLIQHS